MKLNEAISKKINDICIKRKISTNKLASMSCLTQSTVQNLATGKSKNPKVLTIVRICDGLGITINEFFDDDVFNDIERED